MARRNVLSIIRTFAVKQPMVSGKMGKRWHMVWTPSPFRDAAATGLMTIPSRWSQRIFCVGHWDHCFIAGGWRSGGGSRAHASHPPFHIVNVKACRHMTALQERFQPIGLSQQTSCDKTCWRDGGRTDVWIVIYVRDIFRAGQIVLTADDASSGRN